MNKFDKLFSKILIGYILFISPLLIFWWAFYLLNLNIFIGLLIGLIICILLNILFLNKISNNFYNIKTYLLILIFLFYSICIFGFFMGVPIFNVLPGILSGIYIGRKCAINKESISKYKKRLLNSNIFSTLVLIFFCFSSAYIALNDKYTTSNLEGMFNLNFKITKPMLWGIITIGGVTLLSIQYLISIKIANIAYKKINI